MTYLQYDSAKHGYRIQFYVHGVRRVIWLGDVKRTQAETAELHIRQLLKAHAIGVEPLAETRQWLKRLGKRVSDRLAAYGLIEVQQETKQHTIESWTTEYIAGRTDLKKISRDRLENAARHLKSCLGDRKLLASVTVGDAEKLNQALLEKYANSHRAKMIGYCRQFWEAAIKHKLVKENPFVECKVSRKPLARKAYVSVDEADRLLAKCPDQLWRTIITLARFAGLRCPSELMALRWVDIDWDSDKFLVRSSKTEHHANKDSRLVPLFPRVKKELQDLYDIVPEGSVNILTKYRSYNSSALRNGMVKIVEAAGLKVWPKLWVNLRASCRTDLQREFPDHVCNAWLGHGSEVAKKHYLQATEADYRKAVEVGS